MFVLPSLDPWQPTRRALHGWSRVLSSIRGAFEPRHPRFWHISLRVVGNGLGTGPIAAGGAPELTLDLAHHRLVTRRAGAEATLELAPGVSDEELGEGALALLQEHGEVPEIDRGSWSKGSQGREKGYDREAARRYLGTMRTLDALLRRLRGELPGERGPVQLWAHHFDLAFEVYGERTAESEGEEQNAQVAFGFFPGDDDDPEPYCYATPWPWDPTIAAAPLPAGATWQTDGWQGARLGWSEAAGSEASRIEALYRAAWRAGRGVLEPGV